MATPPPEPPAQPTPSRLTCKQVTDLIIDYVSDELDAAIRPVFETHLERCMDCKVFLQTYQKTIRQTRTLTYEELPGAMQDAMLSFLRTKLPGLRGSS